MSETKKPALAIGQKWRTKDGQICTVMTELDRQGGVQTFGVDSNSYAYWSDGKAYTNFSKGQHLEEDELIELIDQPVEKTKQSAFEVRAEFPATEPPKFPEHWDTRAQMDAIITRTRKFNNLLVEAFKAISILAACIVIAGLAIAMLSMFALASYKLAGWPGVVLMVLAICGFTFIGNNSINP